MKFFEHGGKNYMMHKEATPIGLLWRVSYMEPIGEDAVSTKRTHIHSHVDNEEEAYEDCLYWFDHLAFKEIIFIPDGSY